MRNEERDGGGGWVGRIKTEEEDDKEDGVVRLGLKRRMTKRMKEDRGGGWVGGLKIEEDDKEDKGGRSRRMGED